MWVELDVPCRKCRKCLARRAAHWRLRALAEHSYSVRTWFGTLTYNPRARFHYLSMTRLRLLKAGVVYEQLAPEEQFAELHKSYGQALTLWVKRVRKNSGAPLRYLIVAEKHQSGEPHYHLLIHESDPDKPVRHRALKEAWREGFSDFKLVTDQRQLTYAAKYLTKTAEARVRASSQYGKRLPQSIATQGLRELP